MHSQFRFIRRALYNLKRQYSMPITVCTSTINADYETGIQSETLTKYEVARAIVLPTREVRNFMPDLQSINPYRVGAIYDTQLRRIIIDRRDLPITFEPTKNDFIFFNSKRYEIKQIEDYEHKEALVILIDMTRGAPILDVIDVIGRDVMAISHEATYVVQ